MPALLAGVHLAAAQPVVSFTQPTNGQRIVTFAGLAGTAQTATGSVQQVTFSIYDQSTGQYWDGTNFQGAWVSLSAILSGTNWVPAAGVALPAPCCGQYYQLAASATDTYTNTGTTNITVQADNIPPVAAFSPLANGQTVSNLSTLGGSVTDNFGLVASVAFSIHEQDINYGAGRWWNGTNFQGTLAVLPATVSVTSWTPAAGVALPQLNSGQSYDLTVITTDTTSNSASGTITVQAPITVLNWDPGLTPSGTAMLQMPNTNGGNYWFEIIPQTPAVGVWRTALNVPAGQAGVYMRPGSPPNIYSYYYASANAGSNGFVVDANQFQPGQSWYILVHASTNAQWNLVTGDIYVYPLGTLATDASSSTNAPIGAEGMIFYRTTIPSTVLAWQLWLNGAPNTMFVKKSAAPDLASYDLTQSGQMLVVPPYLAGGTFNGAYFIGVSGSPGALIHLDSRQQPVTDLPFNSLTNFTVTATDVPYVTYRVQVPVQQIAWQLNLTPTSGNPSVAVRRDLVPDEFRNDAFSEVPQGVGASVALVPPPPNSGAGTPGLSDGTWYVTIYSTSPYSCGFANVNPAITPESYVFQATNDDPNRAGWRYYVLTNINQQLGSLGWQLSLANQVPGTEIAIRRNAVPGQWSYRNNDDNYYSSALGYVDLSSIYGLLQQPGHQADIWYIGVYNPNQALGSFVLTGNLLTGQPMPFDGAGSSVVVANQPPGQWGFFRITIPSDALGWDLRLVGVTNGNPQFVVSRDTLPTGLSTVGSWSGWPYQPYTSTSWPSGNQWASGGSWADPDGQASYLVPMLQMGMGNPLQAGTYYIGVQDPNNMSSYTLQSRGIGLTNYTIRVKDLSFIGSTNNGSLAVSEGDYYRVQVPGNVPDWKLQLQASLGDVLLKVQKDYLPNSGRGVYGYGDVYNGYGGQLMMKPGDEQWVLLPQNNYYAQEGTNLTAGTYYVLVASQGQNLTNNGYGPGSGWGSGSAGYTLSSGSEPVTVLPNTLSYGNDLVLSNGQAGGEMKFYQFNVPVNIASVEVRLENRVGNPAMYLNQGNTLVGTWWMNYGPYSPYDNPYGNLGGTNFQSQNGTFWHNGSLITLVNPTNGSYNLSVYASGASGNYPDAGYTVRVHAVPPPVVAFDGGTFAVTNQPTGTWRFFQVNVPGDALGWDLRLVGVTNGNPQFVVSRDTLPTGLSTVGSWSGWPYQPYTSTSWPSGNQWASGGSWADPDGQASYLVPMLQMGMGNPLQAGTYYIGVQDPNNMSSYTLQSRGIGLTNYTIRVKDLSFIGSTNNGSLAVSEGDYYRVQVPGNVPDWKLQLQASLGDVLLKVQKDYLPNSGRGVYGYGDVYNGYGGQLMMKPGDEQWVLLPQNNYYAQEGTNLTAGTYYVLVASQGQNLTNNGYGPGSGWGSGSAGYTLSSGSEPVTVLPNTLSYGNDLVLSNGQAGGEMKFYQFNVPVNIASVEVRLENRVGNPAMYLNQGNTLVGTWWMNYGPYSPYDNPYGNLGGTNFQSQNGTFWHNGSLITIPNASSGQYNLSIYGAGVSGYYPDASYVIRVRARVVPQLSFSPDFDSGGLTNVAFGVLADTESDFYQVTVPALVAGAPVLGWKLDLTALNGNPSVRVRQNYLPDNNGSDGTSPFNAVTATFVPPYLTPGTWYVEVNANGSTTYSLTSSAVTTNTLRHKLWVMPALGEANVAPGLTLPFIGDSGVDTNGSALPGDQGIDLKQGQFDYYAVLVPTNNGALLRTELQAISGNPNLYLRVGVAPTLAHNINGQGGNNYDRSLTGGTTEYANWVPLNGRLQSQLAPGIWVMAVQAGGNGNARYRLQLSCGNPVADGVVQDLALNGGSFANQNLNGGDWRYYRVQIPDPAPTNWAVTFSRTLGSARMFVRDTSPPGDGNNPSPANYANPTYNPGFWYSWQNQDLETWSGDSKNEGPYPRFDSPGTYSLAIPPLRPGNVYYLGFWSPVDTTFSVSSAVAGGTMDVTNTLSFYGGVISGVIPGYGTLLYRMDVPSTATRILFSASNSVNVVLSLEQGTIAQAGGPAHWTSYPNNNRQNGNQADVSLDQPLWYANNWPWLPGYSYYLTLTNTSPTVENVGLTLSVPADLAPVSFVAPTNIISTRPNPTVQVAWGVTNLGPGTASGDWNSWYDTVWFSTNGALDANSIDIGNFWVHNQTVPVGDSYRQTNDVSLPMSSSGNYTLFVQVDAGNSIYEANLGDKISMPVSGMFSLTPPDLMPLSVWAPASVISTNANPVIQVAWAVTNQGIGPAANGWYDRVWFSTNGMLDSSSVSLGDLYFSQSLAPGGNYFQTNQVTLPLNVAGIYSYTLFVQVDIYNWIYESNKGNNTSTPVPGTLSLNLPPQIITQPASQLVSPGGSVTFRAVAAGMAPLHYQWQFNNANLLNATNSTFTLNNVQITNSGSYAVVVTNAFGRATSTGASLVVANLATATAQNFGFEIPSLGTGGYQYNPSGASWTFLNNSGISGNASGFTSANPNTPEGTQVAFLQGAGSSISQSIAFPAGSYQVAFLAAQRANYPQVAQTFNVTLDGQEIGSFAPPQSATNYAFYTTSSFSVTNGNHTLAFVGTDTNGSFDTIFLDDVQVIFTPPLQLAAAGYSAGNTFQLAVYGQIGQECTLQASTNLVNWVSILNFTCTNSPMYVADPAARNYSRRYYRLAEGTLPVPLSPIVLGFGLSQPWGTNGLSLMLQGPVGNNYTIQASTNLVNWFPVTNFANANSPLYFIDPQAKTYKQRFYRAVTAP